LAGGAGEFEGDGVVGEAGVAVATGELAGEGCADGAVGVFDGEVVADLLLGFEGGLGEFN